MRCRPAALSADRIFDGVGNGTLTRLNPGAVRFILILAEATVAGVDPSREKTELQEILRERNMLLVLSEGLR